MRPSKYLALVILITFLFAVGGLSVACALNLGDIIEAFGIAYAVRVFAPQINSFTNSLLLQRGIEWEDATKVVPIISVGSGAYVGAAQVVGPPSSVQSVAAVGQGEITPLGQTVRLNALIPISTTNPTRSIDRVEGVGVSAIIDFRI